MLEKNSNDISGETLKTENDLSELSQLKKESTQKKENRKKIYGDYRDDIPYMTDDQIKEAINQYEPKPILDWPKIPYKSIFIIIFLLFSSILFIFMGVKKILEKDKWYNWFSYLLLGVLLFIPGVFYGFFLINILLGTGGYSFDDIPDSSDN